MVRRRRAFGWAAITALVTGLSALSPTSAAVDHRWPARAALRAELVAGPVQPVRRASRKEIHTIGLVIDQSARSTVVWDGEGEGAVRVARSRPDGRWRTPVELGLGELPDAVIDGKGTVTVVWRRRNAEDLVTRRWEKGAWTPVASLTEPRNVEVHVWPFHLGVDDRGDTAVVWNRKYGTYNTDTRDRVEAAHRPAGGGWGAPTVLRKGYGFVHAVFVDGKGVASVVYESNGLRLQKRGPRGEWRRPVRLPFGGERFGGGAATPDRHLVLSTLDGNNDVVAHEKLPGGGWLTGVTVGHSRLRAQAPASIDSQDRATIGFPATDGSVATVRRVPAGSWTAPAAVSPTHVGARVVRLAQGPHGAVALTWVAGTYERPRLWAATRAPGAPWSAPISLTGPRTRYIADVAAAFRPDGDLVVVWTSWLRRSHNFYLLSRTVSSAPAG